MPEGRKEFGQRGRREASRPEAARGTPDFERDRPMYDRLRTHDVELNDLLTQLDAISTFQQSGSGVHYDSKAKDDLQDKIRDRFKEIS